MAKLTLKQDKFVKAYILNGGNATQAAISAGYSEKTARAIGQENLTKPDIASAIKEHQKTTHKAYIWTKEDKLKKLQDLFDMSTEKYFDAQGNERRENLNSAINAIKEHNQMMGDVVENTKPQSFNVSLNVENASKAE